MIHESRLLIVESKGIADVIDRLKIPYLSTFATEGYLWSPRFDSKTGRVKPVAIQERRKHRKELRNQIKWASSWIVATDSDPSGDFIAWSIASDLGCESVQRCALGTPTRDSLIKALASARTVTADSLRVPMEKELVIARHWMKRVGFTPLDSMALSILCLIKDGSLVLGKGAADTQGVGLRSGGALRFDDAGVEHQFVTPASTATIFEAWLEAGSRGAAGGSGGAGSKGAADGAGSTGAANEVSTRHVETPGAVTSLKASFEVFQDSLNRLFAYRDSRIDHPLISYPRTLETGYVEATWDRIQQQFIHLDDLERLKPPAVRETPRADAAHEGIHPLDLRIHPSDMRGYLDENAHWLYQAIHSHHLKAISMAPTIPDATNLSREWIRLSELAHHLGRLHVLRSSGLGMAVTRWLEKGWIEMKGSHLRGRIFPEMASGMASRWFDAWTKVCLPLLQSNEPLAPEKVDEALIRALPH